MVGSSKSAHGGWLALLVGVALATISGRLSAQDSPPDGFVWEDLKEIHARIVRPVKWYCRCGVRGAPPFKDLQSGTAGKPPYEFSPQPFEGLDTKASIWISADSKVGTTFGKSADKYAAEMQAEMIGKNAVLRDWAKEGVPREGCTARAAFFINRNWDGTESMCESIIIVNAAADTLYFITVQAPRSQWNEIERVGETTLANLRIDPKF